MWSLDPETYYTSVNEKISYVLENIEPGSIILLHPMYDQTGETLQVVETILQELKNEGYRFVTVDELQAL